MEKNLYIDASHPNETRIVLKSNNTIEEYEFEDKNNLNMCIYPQICIKYNYDKLKIYRFQQIKRNSI